MFDRSDILSRATSALFEWIEAGKISAPSVTTYPLDRVADAFMDLQSELRSYKTNLIRKKTLVVANKIDLINDSRDHIEELKNYCAENETPYIEISALKGLNLEELKTILFELYDEE